MSAIIFPASLRQMARTITDQYNQTHSIELGNEALLLDGLSSTISIVDADLRLVTEAGTYSFTAHAFWCAFAGAEPTASEAGLLLADSLVRWQALQALIRSWQAFQGDFQQAVALAQGIGGIPIPPYRLDPFVRQTLLAFDGTEETTRVLSRILKLDPAVVVAQATQLGLSGTEQLETSLGGHTAEVSVAQGSDQETSTTPMLPTQPQEEEPGETSVPRSSPFRFTAAQVERIRTAYEQATSVKDMTAELAKEFGCQEHAVRCKLYSLHLPKKRDTGPRRREETSQAATQEGDRSSQGEQQEEA